MIIGNKLPQAISGYFISGYYWLFYCKPLTITLLVVINGYFIVGHW